MGSILLVDDSEYIHEQIGSLLKDKGLRVVSALGAQEGLDRLKSDPTIQLVFLDINMPEMDGMEFLKKLPEQLPGREVAVVMLSGQMDPNLIHEAKAAGSKGWLIKPPNAYNLASFARKYVKSL